MHDPILKKRATEYAKQHGPAFKLNDTLGYGQDGVIWKSNRKTAVKVFERESNYRRERDCYQRLSLHTVTEIAGVSIPKLLGYSDQYWVVEIDIVTPPYLLDFGKAYLDILPPYYNDAHIMKKAKEEWAEWWGDRIGDVLHLVNELQKLGIYYSDPRPGNIAFE